MPQALRSITRFDFSGGCNAQDSPWHVRPNQVLRADNLWMNEAGALQVRDGFTIYSNAGFSGANTVVRVLLLALMLYDNGSYNAFAVGQTQGGLQRLYQWAAPGPWALLATFSTTYSDPQMVPFTSLALFAAGYEVPKFWNGGAFGPLTAAAGQTVPPGAKHIASHRGQCWVYNTAAANTTLDGPSALRCSDVDNAFSWPNGNSTFIGKSDGQTGTGLVRMTVAEAGISPNATLVAFKERATYQIFGTFGSSDFAVQQVKTDMGCIAPRSIQFVPGLGVIRLTHRGFALFDGLNDRLISDSMRPYLFGADDVTGLDWSSGAAALSRSAIVSNPYMYVCVAPVLGSAGMTRLFMYDVLRQTWMPGTVSPAWGALNHFSSDADPNVSNAKELVMAGAWSGDTHWWCFRGTKNDNAPAASPNTGGTPPAWSVTMLPVPTGSPFRRGYHRRVVVKVIRVAAGQSVTAQVAIGPANQPGVSGGSTTITRSALVTADPKVDTSLVGQLEENLPFDINAKGEVQLLKLSGSGAATIRGIEWHAIPGALTRNQKV